MRPLPDVIATEFDEAWYRADLASIVGHRSTQELADWIGELCREQLNQRVIGARFANKSVGAVFGLVLAGGTDVVLKLFPSTFPDRALRAFERCLMHVCDRGFPAPRQLVALFRAAGVCGAFYELIDGAVLDAHRPDVRAMLATALADLARIVIDLDGADVPMMSTRCAPLWEPPHRAGMNLMVAGGEWIDDRARIAKRTIAGANLPLVVAHSDWSAKNALFRDGQLRAILDWDSLVLASEAEMVGRAAAEFTTQWDIPARLTPTPEEASAFVHEYEQARGRRFTLAEQLVVNASAEYLLAHISRQSFSASDRADDEYRTLLRETASSPLISFM